MGATAREAAGRAAAFANLTPPQGRTLAAVIDRVIPAVDGLPGATAADAVHFADLALGGPAVAVRDVLVAGLAGLDASARTLQPGIAGFADLPSAAQDKLLHAVDTTPFFHAASTLAIFGTLSAPQYGGNRNGVGWKLVQIEQRMRWQPPFGWYDAQWTREHPEAAS
jgi:gluconate 2-dehydrogenase gamma chain